MYPKNVAEICDLVILIGIFNAFSYHQSEPLRKITLVLSTWKKSIMAI